MNIVEDPPCSKDDEERVVNAFVALILSYNQHFEGETSLLYVYPNDLNCDSLAICVTQMKLTEEYFLFFHLRCKK